MAEKVESISVTSEDISELRQRFFTAHTKDVDGGTYDDRDISRLRKDDQYVGLFLKSRYNNIDAALKNIHDSLQWRKKFGIRDIREEELLPQLHDRGAIYFHGQDKVGRPILWFIGKLHTKNSTIFEEHKRFLAYHFEKHCTENPYEQLILIMDMNGSGLTNLDMNFVSFMVTCFETYFPNMLAYLIVYNLPWVLQAAWKIIRSWLDPRGVEAVKIIGKKEIVDFLDAGNRPEHMGGFDAFKYVYQGPDERRKVTFADTFDDTAQTAVEFTTPAQENPPDVSSWNSTPPGSTTGLRKRERKSALGPLLSITPGAELKFTPNCDRESVETISLANTSGKLVAFKVKTTNPQKYRVRPSSGRMEAGVTVDIAVCLQPGRSNVTKDKFLVMSMEIDKNLRTNDELVAAWKCANYASIHEHRLYCRARAVLEEGLLPLDKQVSRLNDQMCCLADSNKHLQSQLHFLLTLVVFLITLVICAIVLAVAL